MNKKKKIIIAASSFIFICLFVCGFTVFSGKKASSDNATFESVTFDSDSAPTDLDTPHTYTQDATGGQSDESRQSGFTHEAFTTDPVSMESITFSPADAASENDTLPSHGFSFDTP